MFARPRVLSLVTTRRCTAQCDHCCIGASPRATAAIPVARMHGLIDEAKRVPSIRRIGFTGGECFLLGKDLDALVRHASANGFRTRAVTNGYWAVNERAAADRVGGLRTSGLDELMISTGTFHQRFVPVARIVTAAIAAAAAGIAVRVSVEDCDQQTFDDAELREALAGHVAAGSVVVVRDPWIVDAGGRGESELTHDRVLRDSGGRNGRCTEILSVVTVTPDQQLVACCGHPMEELPRLRIGSVAERTLDEVLDTSPNELLKMWLHVAGPGGIAAFVARYVPGFTLPPSATICQACVALQRDPRAMDAVSTYGSDMAQEIAAAFVLLQGGAQPLETF